MYKEMKDEESQVGESAGSNSNSSSNVGNNNNNNNNGGKRRYKVWAIAGILLLAFWSVFTGSVTLKSWSNVNSVSGDDDINSTLSDDLDILELEEREKLVRQLWNTYTHSNTVTLPKFWLEAFKAAYEDLINDASGVRDGAISEIAKLSVKSIDLESSPDPEAITDSPHEQSKSNIRMPLQEGLGV